MTDLPRRGLFVVGTDTDVGKTAVAVAILRGLVAAGRRVAAYKPVASGIAAAWCTSIPAGILDVSSSPTARNLSSEPRES